MSSDLPSAEEAARKAREIAAKLLGKAPQTTTTSTAATTTESSSGNSGSKRKRWGVAPAETASTTTTAAAAAAVSLPGMDILTKKLKQESEPVQLRLWITNVTKERPAWHYVTYMSPKLPLLIARARDENPAHKDEQLEVTFKGRGSSRQAPLPGIPEEPLHCFVVGTRPLADAAEGLVEELLQEAEQAEVTVDVSQEPDPSHLDPSQNDRQLATTGNLGASSNGSYRPATVAQMIGNPHAPGADVPQGEWAAEEVHVPNGIVGFIIGRGGETITSMQARTGAKVQIQKEHELQPGQTMRIITVSAPTQEQLQQCKSIITSMVEDRIQAAGGSAGRHIGATVGGPGIGMTKDAKVQQALDQGHQLRTVDVPDADVGLIIGKGGATIQDIQGRTGASIQIPQTGNADNPAVRTVSVTHPSADGAEAGVAMINSILATKKTHNNNNNVSSYGTGGMGGTGAGVSQTIQVAIPDKDVGLCIGRQGCVIKEMQNKSGTRIQIPGQPTGEPFRIATVSGTPEACEMVKQMIDRIVLEQSSSSVMTGAAGGPGGYQQQQQYGGGYQQQQQAGGQQDYSAEWAAYYAAQQQAQQQAAVAAPAPNPVAAAPAPGPDANAYHEEFFRYAYYYGEPAARQYYGTWSPPEGTPNPYGVNPNGITAPPANSAPAPTSAAVAAPAAADGAATAAPVDGGAAPRETSRRKVSNLPAWMTRGT